MTEEAICKWLPGDDWQWQGEWAEEQPLIRCKDCGHWDYGESGINGTAYGECFMLSVLTEDMFFCGLAERKEE